ncbi:MAG TPA: lipoyl(octanoyl) transferase LipB [Candidatus Competibacteraceae bacterium]|nr:lipoyl(octanoyl) transferase LipB [Candidatus Competibacteraceae bacterium]
MNRPALCVRRLGRRDYLPVWQAMRAYTETRGPESADEIWLVEHEPVFTQGLAGKPEHVLAPGDIPVVQVDRGGQVTYHGPGQAVIYCLLDLKRTGLGVRQLVTLLEQSVVALLGSHGITGYARPDAPGVYVDGAKIASLGLRVRRGCSYHGLSLNVAMDLAPFNRINPCGYAGLAMTQLRDLGINSGIWDAANGILHNMISWLGYISFETADTLPPLAEQDRADG